MRKWIVYLLIGMGVGQVFYLSLMALMGIETQTFAQMLSVTGCSSLMGLSALIYSWNKLAPLYQRTLHVLVVFGLVVIMMQVNGWLNTVHLLGFTLEFLVIYFIVSLLIMWLERSHVQKINQKPTL